VFKNKLQPNSNHIDRLKISLAISSGLLLTGSFPKIGFAWLAWFALVPLLISLRDLSPKKSFRLGFITGLAHYLTLLYWLAYTMRTYGNLPWYLCVSLLFVFCAFLALYPAFFSMALNRVSAKPGTAVYMVPLLWVSLEYVRGFLFTGFPWALLGYSQFETLQLIQISDIFGVYGVSFLVLISNATIYLTFLSLTGKEWQGLNVTRRLAFGSISGVVLLLGGVWIYGDWNLKSIDNKRSTFDSARVTIVQGNIEQSIKWHPDFQVSTTKKYIDLSLAAKNHAPDLVVWPETATPFYFLRDSGLSTLVQKGIQAAATDFLIGSPSIVYLGEELEYYNSAYLINAKGKVTGKYDKVHLVPFGEYVPFKKWLPFLGKIVAQVGDFRSGKKGSTITWRNNQIGVQICYEIIFPDLARSMAKNDASLLVNLTNDAWYGRSSAPYQHFSMAIFRAVENRRTLVRSANTGISGFIDPAGRILASTVLFEDAVLTRSVPLLREKTFYTRFGDVFAGLCMAVTLLAVYLHSARRFRKSGPKSKKRKSKK
jgi:apolipoprotein N-acyltransferase